MAQAARATPPAATAGRNSGPLDPPLPAVRYERHPHAASAPLPHGYRRREPEKSALHTIIREHLETFLAQARLLHGEGYPRFIEREFRRYLACGILCHGFARVRCPECGEERLVGFSCKGRLCPSCVGRRMADTAAFLVDQLLPEADYRQWVLTLPWALRFRLAVDRRLFAALLHTFLRTLFAWQRRRGRALGIRAGQTGAVTFVQRFGGALNLHPHVHSLVPDGLFVPASDGFLTFVPLPAPTDEEVAALALKVARRLTSVVERLCDDIFQTDALLEATASALQQALATAVKAPVPRDQLSLPGQVPEPPPKPLCARVAGFSLHAAQAVAAEDREGLERLCRYGLRPPFAQDRLALREDGRILYRLRRPWPHPQGATCLVLEPLEFLRRLAALIPAPYAHTIRYHGCFGNRARSRDFLPAPPFEAQASPQAADSAAPPAADSGTSGTAHPEVAPRRTRLPWAQLLRRVFFIDALKCPRCSAAMVVLALISDPPVVARILRHLRLPTEPPPLAPARGSVDAQLRVLCPPRHFDPDDPAGDPLDLIAAPHSRLDCAIDTADAFRDARPPP